MDWRSFLSGFVLCYFSAGLLWAAPFLFSTNIHWMFSVCQIFMWPLWLLAAATGELWLVNWWPEPVWTTQ